jgi:UPF0288 family protein (methanogenesis marker protein 3)
MLKITQNKGFQMTFKNGITISVQMGVSNYCERKSNEYPLQSEKGVSMISSENAEIAIWDKNETWHNFEGDQVKGWVSADETAKWIKKARKAKSIQDIKN